MLNFGHAFEGTIKFNSAISYVALHIGNFPETFSHFKFLHNLAPKACLEAPLLL